MESEEYKESGIKCCKGLGLLFIIVYWISDSLLHYWLIDSDHFELIPDDVHELIMRVIIVLIVLGFSLYIDRLILGLKKAQHENLKIYRATISSSRHIINNLLNSMILYQDEASNTKGFDEDILSMFDCSRKEAGALMNKLEAVREINEENITMSVHPNNNKNFYMKDNSSNR